METHHISLFPQEHFLDIRPYQYGWEECEPLHSFGPFVRNHYLFHYIISGKGMLYSHAANGEIHEYDLEANQGFLICPGQINLYTADEKEPWKYVWIEFDGMHAEECLLQAGLEQDQPIYRPRSIEEGEKLRERMVYFYENSMRSPIHLVGCLYLFLDELIEFSSSRQSIAEKKQRDFYINEAVVYIQQNCNRELTVDELHYRTIKEDEKEIVAVDIQRGTDRPYYLAKKGMRPEGVYVRQGFSSVPATDTAIRRMIKETDGDRFEAMRCLNQELTFETAKKEFALREVDFGPQQMRTLKLTDRDNLYSNLGLLLSDQCGHTIKVAVFQGTDQTIFKDRREFTGSLMQQMNEVYDFIDFRNQTRATIEKLLRIDVKDYPEIAVREALLNLLVHRDYSFSASAFISIYADRIEFVSIGGLMPGIDLEDIMAGISVCRNQDLANVFYRLHLIEAYGTGIGKIMKAYESLEEKPLIETTKNTFKIILPNINAKYESNLSGSFVPGIGMATKYETRKALALTAEFITNSAARTEKSLSSEEKVLEYARSHGAVTRNDVITLLGVSTSTASRVIRKMVKSNLLKKNGKARNTNYTVIK